MSDPIWSLNDVALDTRAVPDLQVNLRAQAVSQMSFSSVALFDSVPAFSYGDTITLKRDALIVFTGKAGPINRAASPQNESHDFFVTDAWQDLEDTIYQEAWAVGNIEGGVLFPMAVLGLDDAGDPITIGDQIEAVVDYAASVGVVIQAGTIAAGDTLWPSEISNLTCAEVIRQSLRFYPDFIPWIDYATTPPSLNVTKRADMTPAAVNVSGSGSASSLRYRRRDDILPDSVRLVYKTAQNIDGEIYRDAVIDKWPAAGPDGGPKVLTANIELAGMDMQFQKSPIQVRTLPTDAATAKDYLKLKFPQLATIPDEDWTVAGFAKTVIADPEAADHDDTTINPNATRLEGTTSAHLPNELVRGTIQDWMRRRIGKVHLEYTIEPGDDVEDSVLNIIDAIPPGLTTVATNATTKIYHGVTQWETGENAPVGLAQSTFTAMTAAYEYEGSVTLTESDIGTTRFHGGAIQITGSSDAGLSSMSAPVHSVDMTIATGETVIGFGPPPHLAPSDILELQRQIRGRPVTWWSKKERAANTLGTDDKPSSKGDTVTPYDFPETVYDLWPLGGSSSSSSSSSGSSSSESSGGSSSESSGSSESAGSEKSSNAIVRAWWQGGGYTALATMESNQVLFEFVLRDLEIRGRRTIHPIDMRFLSVCEPGSMTIAAAPCAATPFPVGAEVKGSGIYLTALPDPAQRPQKVTLKLTGIRKGFGQWNMPERTHQQFTQNEASLRGMYKR